MELLSPTMGKEYIMCTADKLEEGTMKHPAERIALSCDFLPTCKPMPSCRDPPRALLHLSQLTARSVAHDTHAGAAFCGRAIISTVLLEGIAVFDSLPAAYPLTTIFTIDMTVNLPGPLFRCA